MFFLKEINGYLISSPTPDPRRGTGEHSCMNGIKQRINSLVSVISYWNAIMLIPEGVKRCVYGFYTASNKDESILPIYGTVLIGWYVYLGDLYTESGQTSECSFSSVSTPPIARVGSFFSIFRDLQNLLDER